MKDNKNEELFDGFVCKSSERNTDGGTIHKLKGRFRTNYHIKQLNSFSGPETEVGSGSNIYAIEGIASSTSVDHYGTEMSVAALSNMSDQMKAGIPILPRHNSFASGGIAEWDEVIGRTIDAEIRAETVKKGKGNDNFVLVVRSQLYADDERSKELVKRLNRGEPIGQSIGGWFEDITVMESEEGEIERIIIQDVTLDHVAITRAPANPDSSGLANLSIRSIIDRAIKNNKGEDEVMSKIAETKTEPETEQVVAPTDDMSKEESNENRDLQEEYDKLKKEFALLEEEYASLKKPKEEKSVDETKEERTITGFADLPLAAEDVPWDWNTTSQDEVLGKGLDNWDRYKRAHLYLDPEKSEETKSAYKLPFARMINGELMVVLGGVSAAMAALNGARGGVDIPDDERAKAHAHLVKYYEKFNKDAPELKSISDTENNTNTTPSAENENVDSRTRNGEVMTENELKTITEIVTRSVLEALPKASASTEAPSEPEKTEIKETEEHIMLRDRLAKAEGMITKLMSEPVRTGIHSRHITPGPMARHEFSRSVEEAKSAGCISLANVVEENIDQLIEERNISHSQLVDLLNAGLRSAELDGLLNNKHPSWN